MRFERNGKNDLKSAIITLYHIKKGFIPIYKNYLVVQKREVDLHP